MRSLAIALAVLIFVVLGAATAWWLWSDRRQAPSSAAAPRSASLPSDAVATGPDLVLQVNGTTSARITVGSSVFFTVTVTGPAPESWTTRVRFVTADDKPFVSRIDALGSPLTLSLARDRGVRTSAGLTPQEAETPLMHRAEFGTSPDESARVPAGEHTLRAVLPVESSASADGRLLSNTVTLTVAGPDSSAGAPTAPEKARLESAAQFHLLAHKWDEAHRLALQLVARADADASAYTLLGDALNGLRRDDEALAAYQEALTLVPRDLDEAPDYLLARMEEIHARLETANANKERPR